MTGIARFPRTRIEGLRGTPVARSWIPAALLLLLGVGCASVSPWNQDFVEVSTPNFVILSSFGESETRTLARELEVFHAGVLYAVGLPPDARLPSPTRVLAFDDRSLGRPFAIRGESASLVPGVDAATLLIRAPGSLRERVDHMTRHRYAHRVLRSRSIVRPPLWYEEGRAQVAGTVEVSDASAEIGQGVPEHAAALRAWRRSDLADVFDVQSVADRSLAQRREFEAASWAVVHAILFEGPRKQAGRRALDRVRAAYEGARPVALARAVEALGPRPELVARIHEHLDARRHRVDRVQVVGLAERELATRALSVAASRIALARLAFDLDRPALALDYLDRALEADRTSASARSGRALALARLGRRADAENELAIAVGAKTETPLADLWALLAAVELAVTSDTASEAAPFLASARSIMEGMDGRVSDGTEAQAALGLARAALAPGQEIEAGLARVETARRAAPGSLRVDLVAAELQAARGRERAAAILAADVVSRTHDAGLRERAARWLD